MAVDCVVTPCDASCGHCPIIPWGDPANVCCTDTGLEEPELSAAIENALKAATEVVYALSGSRFGFANDRFMPGQKQCGVCSCDPCSCCSFDKLYLPMAPVCQITRFVVEGVDQDLTGLSVQVDDLGRFYVANCEDWPTVQCEMAGYYEQGGPIPACGVDDNWWVEYTYGEPVPILGDLAVNELACQLVYSCTNPDKCVLPSGATNISRQGVSFSVEQDSLELLRAGLIGLPAVDRFVTVSNPYGIRRAPSFRSVDGDVCGGRSVSRVLGC